MPSTPQPKPRPQPATSLRETATAVILSPEPGIVIFEPHKGVKIGLKQVKENNAAITAAAGGERVALVARMNGIVKMDREARAYSADYANTHYRAVALVVGSPMAKMLASFFLGLNKPATPTRVFARETEALAWLRRKFVRQRDFDAA